MRDPWTIVFIYDDGSNQSGVSWQDGDTIEAAIASLREQTEQRIKVVAAFKGQHNDVTDEDTRDFE